MRCPLILIALAGVGLILNLTAIGAAHAGTSWQDWETVREAARRFVVEQAQTRYPASTAKAEIGPIDPRLRFPACSTLDFTLPPGDRLSGGSLGVSCNAPQEWKIYLTFQARLRGPALVSKRPLAASTTLTADDVTLEMTDYDQEPGNYLRDVNAFRGAALARPVARGTAIVVDMLRFPVVVRAGQRVRVLVHGAGFQVSQEGVAQNNAKPGESVKVKIPGNRLIQGMAQQDGSVLVP